MRKPSSTSAKTLRTPVLAVKNAARYFARISAEFEEEADSYRENLYSFGARCYSIGLDFSTDHESYQRFLTEKFLAGVRQKPKQGEIMKSVLTFAMDAKSPRLQNRVIKTAAVLDFFEAEKLEPQRVVARLKEEGGIEKLYRKISGKRRSPLLDERVSLDRVHVD